MHQQRKKNGFKTVILIYGFIKVVPFTVILWWIVYRNNPQKHYWITGYELEQIFAGKGLFSKRTAQVIPWRHLLLSKPLWGIVFAAIGYSTAISVFVFYTPTYLNVTLNFSLLSSGFLSALPFIIQILVKYLTGPYVF